MEGTTPDGFGNKSIPGSIHAKDFKAIRTTVGNFLAAAEWAVAGRIRGNPETDIIHPGVVWSLTSGFHHACYDHAEGFCTVEALTLGAYELWKYRKLRTLIVDDDAHYGNGCVGMIKQHRMYDYCAYMQSYFTHGQANLGKYRLELQQNIESFVPDVIFYQAGADNWVGDPLGGSLDFEQLYQRDIWTFQLAKERGIPVVCNLAGGYAENYEHTLQIHMNTGEAMKEVYLGRGEAVIPVDAM
jgi:acetoin utilization deacetylase AcuC-like enzyme